jgi:hypothetical protein
LNWIVFVLGQKCTLSTTLVKRPGTEALFIIHTPYQKINDISNKLVESENAKTRVVNLAFLKAAFMWSFNSVSYRFEIMFSRVSELTVRKALMDSEANFEDSAKTAWFKDSN